MRGRSCSWYCITCHSQRLKARGATPVCTRHARRSAVANDAKTWEGRAEDAGRRHAAGRHARPDKRRTSNSSPGSKASSIARRAATESGAHRAVPPAESGEYQNAVRDLLDLDIDVAARCCPPTMPATVRQYRRRVEDVADADGALPRGGAEGQPHSASARRRPFRRSIISASPTIARRSDNCPGSRSARAAARSIRYTFPMDAAYTIRVQLSRDLNEQVPIYVEPQQLEVSIDGERVTVFTLPGVAAAPAGPPASETRGRERRRRRSAGRGQGRAGRAHVPAARARRRPAGAGGAGSRRPRLGSARAGEGGRAHVVQVAFLKQTSAHRRERAPAVPAAVLRPA